MTDKPETAYVVTWIYSDGSPYQDTHIEGVFSSRKLAEDCIGAGATVPSRGMGSWYEIEEWCVDVPKED